MNVNGLPWTMRQLPLHRVGGTEGLPRMQGSNHLLYPSSNLLLSKITITCFWSHSNARSGRCLLTTVHFHRAVSHSSALSAYMPLPILVSESPCAYPPPFPCFVSLAYLQLFITSLLLVTRCCSCRRSCIESTQVLLIFAAIRHILSSVRMALLWWRCELLEEWLYWASSYAATRPSLARTVVQRSTPRSKQEKYANFCYS